ncbi:MAG: hypothetical protein ABMA13_00650 [Chthoniobacteraceae bacterium]
MNHEANSTCGNIHVQQIILRLMASVTLIALPAVILPRLAVEKLSWFVGLKEPPHSPLLIYMMAGASAVYVAQGVLLWFISRDVVRYRQLVMLIGWMTVILGPVFVWIHLQAGTPRWWMVTDSLSCFVAGLALLWACRSR